MLYVQNGAGTWTDTGVYVYTDGDIHVLTHTAGMKYSEEPRIFTCVCVFDEQNLAGLVGFFLFL